MGRRSANYPPELRRRLSSRLCDDRGFPIWFALFAVPACSWFLIRMSGPARCLAWRMWLERSALDAAGCRNSSQNDEDPILAWDRPSVDVRRSPPLPAAIVTHFVTRWLVGRCCERLPYCSSTAELTSP